MQRIAVALVLLACLSMSSAGAVSTNVPVGHWSYEAVEKLTNYRLTDSAMLTTKPLTRLEMARHVAEARDALALRADVPEVVTALVERLTREYQGELMLLGALDGVYNGATSLKPVEDPYVKYLYATETPDLENRRGDVFQRGSNFRAGLASRGTLFNTFAFYLHPEYAGAVEEGSEVRLVEGYGKVGIGPFELEAGRDSLWWGPGYHGSMIMSNNARPFDMLKVTNAEPVLLPWIFRAVGPIRVEWFLARLEEHRRQYSASGFGAPDPTAHPLLTGLRINIRPHPLLELSASRVAMFGGHGRPGLDFFDYFKPLVSLTEETENNQLAGFDGSLLIPLPKNGLLRSIKLYGDAAGEDHAGFLPSKWGELLGLQFNDLFKTGRTDLRLEYADDIVPGSPDVFYTHAYPDGLYSSGYTYEGRVIGHHMGTQSRDLFVQLSHYLTNDVIVDLAYDRHAHGRGDGTRATANIFELGVTWFVWRDWQILGGYRFEQRDEREGGDNHIVEMGFIRRF